MYCCLNCTFGDWGRKLALSCVSTCKKCFNNTIFYLWFLFLPFISEFKSCALSLCKYLILQPKSSPLKLSTLNFPFTFIIPFSPVCSFLIYLWFCRSSPSGLLLQIQPGEPPDWRRWGAPSSERLLPPADTQHKQLSVTFKVHILFSLSLSVF